MVVLYTALCIFLGLNSPPTTTADTADKATDGESMTGYRAFPRILGNPSRNRTFTKTEFDAFEKTQMETVPSVCENHTGTTAWYVKDPSGISSYVLQIKLKDQPDVFIESLCTFTPYQGMDYVDGLIASDVEAYVLHQKFGYESDGLLIFKGKEEVLFADYLQAKGIDISSPASPRVEDAAGAGP
jgi:hypothetical protein